jgi:hypothetical protein
MGKKKKKEKEVRRTPRAGRCAPQRGAGGVGAAPRAAHAAPTPRPCVPLQVIFCFYCDRTFNDEATLVQHQKVGTQGPDCPGSAPSGSTMRTPDQATSRAAPLRPACCARKRA